jgi:hypothetical protein
VIETPAASARPRLVATLTAVGWNLIPLAGLIVWVVYTLTQRDQGGEDWSGVIALILIALGGGAIAVAGSAAAVIAFVVTGRQLRRAELGGRAVTTGHAVLIGSLAALAGLVLAMVAVTLFVLLTNGTFG